MAKKLRFKVGQRVTCARGICIEAAGRIVRRAPATSGKIGADWVVRLDRPTKLGSSEVQELRFDDDELEPWTVPPEARPLSVGALQHPARHYLDRHSLSERCNVCSAKAGEPCVNLLEGTVLRGTHTQAPKRQREQSIAIALSAGGKAKVTRG